MSDLTSGKELLDKHKDGRFWSGRRGERAVLKRLQPARRVFSICQTQTCQLCSCWMIPFPMISPIDFIGSAHRELDQTTVLQPQERSHPLLSYRWDRPVSLLLWEGSKPWRGCSWHSTCFLLPDALGKEMKDLSSSPFFPLGLRKGHSPQWLLFPCVWEARRGTRYGPLLLALACWPWSSPKWGATLHEKGAEPGSPWPEGFTWPRAWGQYKPLEERCSNNASSAFTGEHKSHLQEGGKKKKGKEKGVRLFSG